MSYLVLARKFRPQTFEDIIGQEHVTTTLQNAITANRVHHAFLFCGARGTGKTTTARVLAKALNCKKGPTPTPCNQCNSCIDIAAGNSVDVLEIDGASHTGVDDIRELRENVRYSPTQGRRKIYIIDEVHMLSVSAFNALLKTLEEPPAHITFMFATTEPHKIPATILSRCQRFDLRRVAPKTLIKHLSHILEKEGFKANQEALDLLALESGGSVRDSLSLMDQVIAYAGDQSIDRELVAQVLGVTDRSTLTSLSEALLTRQTDNVLSLIDEVFKEGWDLVQFSKSLVEHLRDLAVLATCKSQESLVALGKEEIKTLKEQIEEVRPQRLLQLFDAASRAVDEVSRSEFPKMTLEMNLLEMTLSEPLVPIGEITSRLERMENRLLKKGGSPPPKGGPKGGSPSPSGGSSRKPPASSSRGSRNRKAKDAVHSKTATHEENSGNSPLPETDVEVSQETPTPKVPSSVMLEKWETIVSMVRNEDKLLAATLASINVDALTWTDSHVQVKLLAEKDSFSAEQLLDGGLDKASDVATGVLHTPVKLSLTLGTKEEVLERAGSNLSAQNTQTSPSVSKQQTKKQKSAPPPRSLRDRRELEEQKRQKKIRKDAREHPSVREAEKILGGKVKKIDILS